MRIVSENSSKDLRRRAAERQLGFALRALAANMLRIMRGAGKSYRFTHEFADCARALNEYLEATDHSSPSDIIERALNPETSWPDGDRSDRYHDAWRADLPDDEAIWLQKEAVRREMREAALRITASMLAGQSLQIAHGEKDLTQALAHYERLTDELRALRATQRRGGRPAQKAENARVMAIAMALATRGKKGEGKPALADTRFPQPPSPRQPHDRLQPPSYDGLRVFDLPAEIREEFGVASAMDLVLWLNRLRRERGVAPVPQG